MKHYIYITPEGVINWIEKMPAAFKAYDIFKSEEEYNNDIELAKAESIIADDNLKEYVSEQHNRRIASLIPYTFEGRLGYRGALIPGEIYTIELDADIQTVDSEIHNCEYCIAGKCQLKPRCTTLKAKIIPKKAEESEDELLTSVFLRCKLMIGPISEDIKELKRLFEIKRKPL